MKKILSLNKRKARISLILILTILMQITMPMLTKVEIVEAVTTSCGDAASFGNIMRNANDGDVVKITNNMTLGQESKFRIKDNCLVTLDLNGHTINFSVADVFDVGSNAALLVKNGTLDKLDTANNAAGIMILNGVRITDRTWLGHTVTWVVNNCRIAYYSTEQGNINSGASGLHPVGRNANGSNYNYENSAPAMIGSGTRWTIYNDLPSDFNTVNSNSSIYNNVILLKDSNLTSDANLTAPNVTIDLSEYKLTTGDYFKISNDSGTTIIRNGTINGNIDMSSGSGNVELSNMEVTGAINNGKHTLEISNGTYNDIYSDGGKVIINGGYFKGTISGGPYEINGGYFENKPDFSYLEDGYMAIECEEASGYSYKVVEVCKVTFETNGHGTAQGVQVIQKGQKAIMPTDMAEQNYTFEGWFEDSKFTIPYDFDTKLESDITLYAKWELNLITDGMVSVTDYTTVYDGEEYTVNVTNNTTDVTIKYGTTEGIYDLDEAPKYSDAGEYIVYYKATKDNYVDKIGSSVLTIEPAEISEISFEDMEFIYDGNEHTIKVNGELTGGTIKYGIKEGEYNLEKLPKFTDMGTYTIYYKASKNNYIDKTGTAIVKINPIPLTVKAKDKTITYGDETPVFDYEIISGSLVDGEKLSNIMISQLADTNAGTYTITISQTEGANSNYDITFENGIYTINKKEITPEVTLNQSTFTYNLVEQKPTVSVKEDGYELPTSEYILEFTEDSTNAGNKQVRVICTNINYIFTDVYKEYVIKPKAIDSAMIKIEKNQYVYDTHQKTPVVTIKYGDKILVKDKDYEILDTSTSSAKNAGNYNIIVKGKENYAEEYTIPWTITKTQIKGVEIRGVDTIYDGNTHKIDVTIPSNAKISYKTEIDSQYLSKNPKFKDVGNYTVYYKVEIDNNYEVIENSAVVIIRPKDVQVSADNIEKIYADEDPKLEYTAEGLVGFEKLEGITLSREVGEDVGAYIITAKQDTNKDTNYNITLNDGTFTINTREEKNPKITVETENIIYTGNQIEPIIVIKDSKENVIPNSEYEVSYSNNINAGKAKITVTNKDGGNYIVDGSKTFIINAKEVENPIVEFNQTEYAYTGSKVEPEIIVKNGEKVIPADEYEISYKDNTNVGTATTIIKNKKNGNYQFKVTATFEIVNPGSVQLVNPNVPNANKAILKESANSLYSKIDFTDEELELKSRGRNIDIYLEVTEINNNISPVDKQLISSNVKDIIGTYFDISLFKKITGEDATKITNTKEPILITFEIPTNLINNDPNINRTYKIARLHEGVVTLLNAIVENNTVTFETDEFSTYALIYSDEDISNINDIIKKINEVDIQKLIGSKTRIVSARESYDALDENQKEKVTNYENLVNAENEYKKIYDKAVSNSSKFSNQ